MEGDENLQELSGDLRDWPAAQLSARLYGKVVRMWNHISPILYLDKPVPIKGAHTILHMLLTFRPLSKSPDTSDGERYPILTVIPVSCPIYRDLRDVACSKHERQQTLRAS